jgi:S1-C subfamily serine protease
MDPSHPPTLVVKILSGGLAGLIKEFSDRDEILIGRDAAADVRLHPTEDAMVGRRHARILRASGEWQIEPIHDGGVWIGDRALVEPRVVSDGDVYRLGRNGPEFRVSLLDTTLVATVVSGRGERREAAHDGHGARSAPATRLRRAEFDPAEVEAAVRSEAGRRLRFVVPGVLVGVAAIATALYLATPRADPLAMSGSSIQREFGPSVFRAASTVLLRSGHADVGQSEWTRYWIRHGSAFAVALRGGYVYALTNHHVFGDPARADLDARGAREHLTGALLERWSADWSRFAAALAAFDGRRSEAGTDSTAMLRVARDRGVYLEEIVGSVELRADPDWRQVVVDGRYVPVEIVAADEPADVMLFRFRVPDRPIAPLRLREVRPDDRDTLSGLAVFILGYPGVGDLPHRRLADAMRGEPDVASGVVSNVKRDDEHRGASIQVTAPINEGNSGGPLFDAWGNAIGLNTWGPSKAEAEGVAYSVALSRGLEMLREHGLTPLDPIGVAP